MPDTVESAPWTAEGDAKRTVVRDLFAEIAPVYDRVNGIMSFSLHHRWRTAAVRQINLQPGESVLDLCCGTGDFLFPIQRAVGNQGKVVGLDFCLPMLQVADQKFTHNVPLIEADACRIPLADAQFDAVTVGWGLRNVPDLEAALAETVRVLKPGGRFVCLDMARPQGTFGAFAEWVCHTATPIIGSMFKKSTAYKYLPKSTLQFADRETLKSKMEAAGLTNVKYRNYMFGNICMHWGSKP